MEEVLARESASSLGDIAAVVALLLALLVQTSSSSSSSSSSLSSSSSSNYVDINDDQGSLSANDSSIPASLVVIICFARRVSPRQLLRWSYWSSSWLSYCHCQHRLNCHQIIKLTLMKGLGNLYRHITSILASEDASLENPPMVILDNVSQPLIICHPRHFYLLSNCDYVLKRVSHICV